MSFNIDTDSFPFAIVLLVVQQFLTLVLYYFVRRKKIKHQNEMQKLHKQQQNQLIEAAVRSEETERHRIAEALHDEIGAILSSAKLHLQSVQFEGMDEKNKKVYDKGKDLLNDGIQRVRAISHNLHSGILKEFGLNEAIKDFVTKTIKGTIIKLSIALDENYTTKNAERDVSIYRIIQELINNMLKHAHPKEIKISSVFTGDVLEISIHHNGHGLSQEQFEKLRFSKDGLGLKNIQNRVILLKGNIEFIDGSDYSINLNIPINPK